MGGDGGTTAGGDQSATAGTSGQPSGAAATSEAMGSAPAPQPLQSDPSDPTATASAAGAAAPAVNHIAVELQWLSNPPKSWLHPDTGDAPGFADHMFNYEVELQLSQPSASASTQEPQPTPRDADDAAREAGASLLRHTFVYGKLHSIDAAAVQMLDTGVAVPTASSALQDDLTSADGSGTAPSKVAGSGLKAGSVPTASSAVQEALQPQQPAEVADDPPPVGVMWLWSKPQAEPEVEPAAKGAKKDPKQARRQSEAPRPAEKPEQDTLSANHVVRVALTEQMLYQLEQALEDGGSIGVSFRRVLSSRAAPEWEDVNELRYRATAAIPLAPFEEPGIDSWLYEACPLKPAAEEEDTAGGDKRGKKPAAKRGAKGAAAPPPYLIQEEDFGDVHPYLQLGTALRVKVSLDHPLVCLPERRPRPPRRPTDMIRRRLKHHKRPADAVVQYHHRVAAIVHSLVSDFLEMRGDMRDGEAACNDDIRRKFLQHIGSTGKYRREIRDALLRVVREHFGKKPGDSPEAMSAFYDELYVFMVEEMHRAIGRVFMRDRLAPQFRVQEENAGQARWLRLATEAEVVQEFAVAARYHQERLARGPDPGDENPNALADMWTEYGRFCLRSRDAVKAEEAFREAVSHSVGQPEPVHLPSLLALGLLLLSKDRFEEAEVCLQSAVDARMHDRLPWGSLALCHERAALVAGTEAENKQRLKRAKYARLFAARAAAGKVPATSDDCATGVEPEDASDGLDLALAKYTLGLWLEDITDHCLSNLPGSDTAEVLLLRGRMNFQLRELDQVGGARDWLANRLIKQEPKHYEGLLLLGDVYASLGESLVEVAGPDGAKRSVPAIVVAEEYYDRALRIDAEGAPGPVYVRLGNIHNSLGRYEDARDAFILGAKAWPCGLTWMGVGIGYYRLGDMKHAEQALCESNLLNNMNSRTWAYLCLVCLRQDPPRITDADFSFNQAIRLGLNDPDLLAEIGVEQQHHGRVKLAEGTFLRSLKLRDVCTTRLFLAGTLTAMRRFDDAREQLRTVVELSDKTAERLRAERELAALAKLEAG